MSSESGVDAAAPALNLTPEEKRVYGILFRQADTDNVGVVTGEVAVKFFEKTRLDSRILGEIWQIADKENRGFLTPAGFGIVLRLIGHAQAGHEPTAELALQQGPLPRFDGINIAAAAPPPPPPPSALQAQATGGVPVRIPPLTAEKVSQYSGLFEKQNLQNGGILPGDQAKNIFEKSGLPNEILGRIWQLVDTEQRGALVLTEFVIAMHLLTSIKSGTLKAPPSILPAGLYEAATRRGSLPRQSPTTTGPPIPAIPRQLSGQAQLRTNSPLGRPPLGPQATGVTPQITGGDWLVTPADKARFDQFYADLDKANKGFITGEEAVPFLSQSGLSEDALAQIWDLVDIPKDGRLTRDTFAVAMYLIRQQRSRRDIPLPTVLPPNLIPPSMRPARAPVPQSAFDAPVPSSPPPPSQQPHPQPQPHPKSALDDLFGLDASSSPAPPQVPLSTGGSASRDPFANGPTISPVRASPTGNTFRPFVPSSSFGKTLTSHDTGGSSGSGQTPRGPPALAPSNMEDLLGDNDPEISKKLTNETAELANLSSQVGSLSKQMQQVQGQRSSTQNEINQASEQKKNFEQRLSQLRTLYEKEAQDVRALEEQLRTIREDTRKLTNEMVTIDGNYQDLQAQHRQLSQALQADQQENAAIKQRISVVNAEISQLRPQIEKLKSEARQQKGLVAISKKQLSTAEADRDKFKTEVEDLTKSNEEISRQINASSPVSAPAQATSPTPSTTSNPFFRRPGSTDIMGAFASPPVKAYGEKSFSDIFGELDGETTSPPPMTSFPAPDTSTSTGSIGFATPNSSTPTISGRQGSFAGEAPVSAEPRQPSPGFGAFGESSETLNPSRQVSPPVSRAGENTTTAAIATLAPAPIEPASTGQSLASASDTNPKWSSLPAQSEDRPKTANDGPAPGSFPDETSTAPPPNTAFASKRDSDLFGNLKDSGNAKVDFESAFASMGGPSTKPQDKSAKDNTNAFSSFNSEFPPISELERDDESDSASEGNGFEDDFAPASPENKRTEAKEASQAPSSPTASKASAATPDASTVDGTAPASHASQPSNDLSAFPEPPVSSPSFPPSSKPGDPFVPTPSTATNATSNAPKGAFDDLDDEFEGLEDAKEGSADDEFANMSRSHLDDFNPVFDSSPPPSQPKSESTNVSNAFGIDSSYDFGTISSTSAATASAAPATNNTNATSGSSQAPPAPNNQDWEALFSNLESPNDATANTSGGNNKSPVPSQSSPRPSTAGRALSDEGKPDDPIVKNLTGMGYSRTDAVNALEKYDYNLERAANYLANQS
ncbi:hypothetical protein GGS23DRAFT_564049 [Durotheca rogersii]|uniref:uncharacterized protein n=1 Tax=Durotheca rogersii TaxID=419775 RepID=UPI00221F56B5|nr:uncharacterized protein GGS23DRAFT_564049 [Durotheca rogersii]KAI5864368.1 hypothetical protein GGS23DRAFT_564049 [Durotheca rogersii]